MITKKLKHSRQREALIEILKGTKTHPTADWLYLELRKEFPNVSLATVYRNLKLLSDEGDIIRIDVGSGTEHYDADNSNHYHFVCGKCGSIIDLAIPLIKEVDKAVEEACGGRVDKHSLIFWGMCKKCN